MVFRRFLLAFLPGYHSVQFRQLGQTQGPLELHHPVVEADEAAAFQPPIRSDVVMAVVMIFRGPAVEFGIVHDHHASLTGGQGLDRIKGKGADGAEGTQIPVPDKAAGRPGPCLQ